MGGLDMDRFWITAEQWSASKSFSLRYLASGTREDRVNGWALSRSREDGEVNNTGDEMGQNVDRKRDV